MAQEISPAADFQALPLEFIIAQPLTAVVKAQLIAAQATRQFIEAFIENGKPVQVEFSTELRTGENEQPKAVTIKAPLLAMVPVPHLRVDSLRVNFKYEISQTITDGKSTDKGVDISANSGTLLSPWVNASVKGHLSSTSKQESVMNRSGVLEIEMHASESPMPEGLAKLLNMLSNAISVDDSVAAKKAKTP